VHTPNTLEALAAVSVLLLAAIPQARAANSLQSDTSVGSTNLTEALTYDGSQDNPSLEGGFDWNLAFTLSRTTQPATDGTPDVRDTTSELSGGGGYGINGFAAGAGLTYSTTPAEGLHSLGPNLRVGYTYKFGEPEPAENGGAGEETSPSFRPSVGLKALFSNLAYTEDLTGSAAPRTDKRKLAPNPAAASESIVQRSAGLQLDVAPWDWLSFKAIYTRYFYNKNVHDFIERLDSPRAVQLGASGFGATLAGFPSHEAEFGATIRFLEAWSVDATDTLSKSANDGSASYSLKIAVNRDIGETWRAGVGMEHDSSSSSGVQNLALLSIGHDL